MPSILQLRYFCELARHENVSRVAESNYVSQTALSNSIARLEDELGVPLFDRVGRRIVLNKYGEAFFKKIEPSLNLLDDAIFELNAMKTKDTTVINLSTNNSFLWVEVVEDFLSLYPDYTIKQADLMWDEKGNGYSPNSDLIIAGVDDLDPSLYYKVIFKSSNLWICVSQNHHLADRDEVYLSELKDENFIILPGNAGFNKFCSDFCHDAGFTPHVVAECDYLLKRKLVTLGTGIIFATDLSKKADFFSEGKYIPIAGLPVRREIAVFWRKDRKLSPASELFRDFIITSHSDIKASDVAHSSNDADA